MKTLLFIFLLILNYHICVGQFQLSDKGAITSLMVQEIASDHIIASRNEDLRLTPASLTKIVTTATALELLGPNFTYKTTVYCLGKIKKDRLLGNLLIKSNGDPTLGSKYFDQTAPELIYSRIAEELKMAGISIIDGTILLESDTINYSPSRLWEDMGNYYGASPQGFNWSDNTTELSLRSAEAGRTAEIISIEPKITPYTIKCLAVAATHNSDSAYVYGIKNINDWWIEGSIPQHRNKFKIKAAMPNPAQTFKNGLEVFLKDYGIFAQHNEQSHSKLERTVLFTYHSPTMLEMIKNINHVSNNLFADQLLLTLGKEYKGVSSWDNGNKVIEEFWRDKIGFKTNFRLHDGSGLSPKNLISANGMVQLLTWMQKNSINYEVFEQSLAKGGESGTLRSVFKNPQLKGKIRGKSGSMQGVLGYCGYLTTLTGREVAFCVITNNYLFPTKEIRKEMDELLTHIALEK